MPVSRRNGFHEQIHCVFFPCVLIWGFSIDKCWLRKARPSTTTIFFRTASRSTRQTSHRTSHAPMSFSTGGFSHFARSRHTILAAAACDRQLPRLALLFDPVFARPPRTLTVFGAALNPNGMHTHLTRDFAMRPPREFRLALRACTGVLAAWICRRTCFVRLDLACCLESGSVYWVKRKDERGA